MQVSEWELTAVEFEPGDPDDGEFWYKVTAKRGTRPSTEELLRDMSFKDRIQYGYSLITLEFWLQPNVHVGKFEVSSLFIETKDVTSALLRTIPIQHLTELALQEMSERGWPGLRPMITISEEARRLWPKNKDQAALFAGEIYKAAMLRGLAPVEEVERQFDVSRSTATRIISHARKTGYLNIEPVHLSKRKAQKDNGKEETTDR